MVLVAAVFAALFLTFMMYGILCASAKADEHEELCFQEHLKRKRNDEQNMEKRKMT